MSIPPAAWVVPEPLIVPPVQVKIPLMITSPEPEIVAPLLMASVLLMVEAALIVRVPPFMRIGLLRAFFEVVIIGDKS